MALHQRIWTRSLQPHRQTFDILTGTDGAVIASGTQTFNITGDITGNLSGSVGSVTGNVGGNVSGRSDRSPEALAETSQAQLARLPHRRRLTLVMPCDEMLSGQYDGGNCWQGVG